MKVVAPVSFDCLSNTIVVTQFSVMTRMQKQLSKVSGVQLFENYRLPTKKEQE